MVDTEIHKKKPVTEFKPVKNGTRDIMYDGPTDYLVSGMVARNNLGRSVYWTIGPTGLTVHDCLFDLNLTKSQ